MRRLVVLAGRSDARDRGALGRRGRAWVPLRRRRGRDHLDLGRSVDARAAARAPSASASRHTARSHVRLRDSERATHGARSHGARGGSIGCGPVRRYSYFFVQGRAQEQPSARSRRRRLARERTNVRFAVSGDADATPGPNGKPGFNRFQVYGRDGGGEQRLQHQPRRHDLLGQRGRPELRLRARFRRSGRSTSSAWRCPRSGGFGLRPASTATGTTTSSSTTSREPRTATAIYAAGVKAFPDYAPVA